VRKIVIEALARTNQQRSDNVIGLRLHYQQAIPLHFSDEDVAACKRGEIMPSVDVFDLHRCFLLAMEGHLFTKRRQVCQFLITKGWGVNGAVQITAWEPDFGRRQGVQ
jgi:hypothetical protein